jgi:hypothetical protein
MEYTKQEKISFAAKSHKAFYSVLSKTEKIKRLEFLKNTGKDDVNTLAKIKALEELIK